MRMASMRRAGSPVTQASGRRGTVSEAAAFACVMGLTALGGCDRIDAARGAVASAVPHEMVLLDLYDALRGLDDEIKLRAGQRGGRIENENERVRFGQRGQRRGAVRGV